MVLHAFRHSYQAAFAAPSNRLSVAQRLAAATLGTAGLALLIIARGLEPDPRGFGTHEQLGLSPCTFQRWTGQQCPTCGATTAWSYALRGEMTQAAGVNLGGALSCVAALIGVPWLLLSALLRRWVVVRPNLRLLLTIATGWLLVALVDWLSRLYLR